MGVDTKQELDANDRILHEVPAVKQRTQYNSSNLPIYIGRAAPGTAEATEGWQIIKMTYSGNNVIAVDFANGRTTFDVAWTARASLSYS